MGIAVVLVVTEAVPAAEVPVRTTSLTLQDDVTAPIDPGKRRLRFKASTKRDAEPNVIVPPALGGPADPQLTGATLVIKGTGGTTDRVQIALPAANWTRIGSLSRPRGFRYQDGSPDAAVSKLVLKADLLNVRGGDAAFTYTLDEAMQGRVGMRLSMGDTTWCSDAPAKATGSPPSTARSDLPGKFTAQPKSPPPAACTVGPPAYALAVTNGYGSGNYAAGSTVHVWAAVRPDDQLVTGWTGDAALLADPGEWHSTLVMPARDAAVAATIVDRQTALSVSTFTGVTARAKTIRALIPPTARGLVLFLHGTGGGNGFITSTETLPVVLRALESGYGVLGTEAEEAVAGDLDGDGRERWDAGLTAGNLDFGNLNALVADLRAAGAIGPATPLYALGMSNGGSTAVSLGAVGASAVAAVFPELRFRAVVSHCADARPGPVAVTTTPTAWLLCGRDDNPQVDNDAAVANSAALAGRGVPTFALLHPASPLYAERFLRVAGIALATSQALAGELRAAGFVGADGFFTTGTDAIVAAVTVTPALVPTLTALPGGVRLRVVDQMRAMQAEHQMFSDWAARAIAFFDAA